MIHTSIEGDGLCVATIDMPGKKMNVFSAELMDALDALMDRVDSDASISCVVLTSGKSTFLAGAELTMVRGFTEAAKILDDDGLRALCGRLGRQFVRLENSVKPWVAAINGLALGGGLELVAACRERVAANDPRLQLGVPEVRWGLLPGAGGTQRLPRFAGFEEGMQLLLSGKSISPADALRLHIVDQVVPSTELLDTAKTRARALRGVPYDPNVKFANLEQTPTSTNFGISDDDFAHIPAYRAIIDSVVKGARLPLAEATEVEMTQFLTLMRGPVAKRMIHSLYLERLRADKAHAVSPDVGIERIEHGPVDDSWLDALVRSKLPVVLDAKLEPGTFEIIDRTGKRHRAAAGELVLSKAGPYGRVLEIVGSAEPVFVVLAQRLGAMPWRTPGPESALERLAAAGSLEAQARVAHDLGSLDFIDVAACLAGISPAWSGGPLSYEKDGG